MVCQLRYRCAVLMYAALCIISTSDVTRGFQFRLVCPDNYTAVANHSSCVTTHDGELLYSPLYVELNEKLLLTRETFFFILAVSISAFATIIVLLVSSVLNRRMSRWKGGAVRFIISKDDEGQPKYELLGKDSQEATSVKTVVLLTGTPFYEADSTQRMVGIRGHIL